MLDGIAEVVSLAYRVWPSYGGAFVLVSVLVGLLFAPLTVRSSRSRRTLVTLQPEIQRIRAEHASNPATRNAMISSLYRDHGVALGSIFVLIILQWAMAILLYLLVGGFATLDPSNGGGPRYLDPGTELWQSLKDSGGHLTWLGLDLGRTMFGQGSAIGVFAYTMLLTLLIVLAGLSSVTATEFKVSHGVVLGIGGAVVSLILPGAIVVYLVTLVAFNAGLKALTTESSRLRGWLQSFWSNPYREFQERLREAARLDEAGSVDAASSLRLSAITEFVGSASVDRLIECFQDIQHNLLRAVAQHPSNAVSVFSELNRRCPQCVSKDMTSSVVRAWVCSPRLDRFKDDWATIEPVLVSKSQDSLGVLLDACRRARRDELTGPFRRGVTTHLWTHLDRNLRLAPRLSGQALDGHQPAFELLDLVIVPRSLSRADQLCALGDLALDKESALEAIGRYQAAVQRGSTHAAERLAYHQAREGHRLLSIGEIAAAREKFAEARRLHNDQEYVFLAAITDFLNGDAAALDRLGALDGSGAQLPGVAFWRAIAHLRRGEQGQATALLRGLADYRNDTDQRWGPTEEGAVILAVLEKNDQALIDWARRLVRTHGRQWLSAGPSDPWPVVAAVARHDRDLLGQMIALVGNPRELPEWVRTAGAHALLMKSVESARVGQVGAAASDAQLAHNLLRDKGGTTSSGSR